MFPLCFLSSSFFSYLFPFSLVYAGYVHSKNVSFRFGFGSFSFLHPPFFAGTVAIFCPSGTFDCNNTLTPFFPFFSFASSFSFLRV